VKKTACIYTSNTGVGLISDVNLIQDLLYEDFDIDVVYLEWDINDSATHSVFANYDIGIFIQEFGEQWLDRNKINILIANEEWILKDKLLKLKYFNKIITKSSFAKYLLSPYNSNIVNTGFVSLNKNLNIDPAKEFLHLAGKSSQKGTEAVLSCFNNNKLNLTFLQSDREFNNINSNIHYISEFIPSEDIALNLNNHSIHLCPSIYEGWGHYLYEGMSTGALIYATKIPMFVEWIDPDLVVFLDCIFCSNDDTYHFLKHRHNEWPHQVGWLVDKDHLTYEINNYKANLKKHKPDKVRSFFKHINNQNSKKLFKELTNV
jgi:hypothetical protein